MTSHAFPVCLIAVSATSWRRPEFDYNHLLSDYSHLLFVGKDGHCVDVTACYESCSRLQVRLVSPRRDQVDVRADLPILDRPQSDGSVSRGICRLRFSLPYVGALPRITADGGWSLWKHTSVHSLAVATHDTLYRYIPCFANKTLEPHAHLQTPQTRVGSLTESWVSSAVTLRCVCVCVCVGVCVCPPSPQCSI